MTNGQARRTLRSLIDAYLSVVT